jgi:hypothetical protein
MEQITREELGRILATFGIQTRQTSRTPQQPPEETAPMLSHGSSAGNPMLVKRARPELKTPSRVPIFIGIFATGHPEKEIRSFISQGLNAVGLKYEDDPVVTQNMDDIELDHRRFAPPRTWHVTTFYIGNDPKRVESPFFKRFQEGMEGLIELFGIVYVPDCIFAGFCFPNPQTMPVENRIPHMTLLVGRWVPKMSNLLLEALFTGEGPLAKHYQRGDFKQRGVEHISRHSVNVSGESVMAYVIKTVDTLTLTAETKGFYGD